MTQQLDIRSEPDPDSYHSPHELTPEQSLAARAAYERLGHDRLVGWDDLPDWQRAGYHRLALVGQIASMQRLFHLSGAIDEHHGGLVAAVAADVAADGWGVLPPSTADPLLVPDSGRDPHLDALVRRVLTATATHLTAQVD